MTQGCPNRKVQAAPTKLQVVRPEVLHALQGLDIQTKPRLYYVDLMTQMVFIQKLSCLDAKDEKHHQKILYSYSAQNFLNIVWKESDFVTDAELMKINARKVLNKKLNAYALAVLLSDNPNDVGKNNSHIHTIITSSAKYNLIFLQKRGQSNLIHATPLLNDLMIALGQRIKSLVGDATSAEASADNSAQKIS